MKIKSGQYILWKFTKNTKFLSLEVYVSVPPWPILYFGQFIFHILVHLYFLLFMDCLPSVYQVGIFLHFSEYIHIMVILQGYRPWAKVIWVWTPISSPLHVGLHIYLRFLKSKWAFGKCSLLLCGQLITIHIFKENWHCLSQQLN